MCGDGALSVVVLSSRVRSWVLSSAGRRVLSVVQCRAMEGADLEDRILTNLDLVCGSYAGEEGDGFTWHRE